jgi:glycosyltransferase involved in cell wall biosynthesis
VRIGVDATCWSNRRGYGRFARALLSAALELDPANQYVFFADDECTEFPLPPEAQVVRVRTEIPTVKAAGADGHRQLKDMWALSRAMSRASLDLIFFPSIYSYVPIASRVPKLVTIHDVIPELYPDLVFPTLQSKLFWRAKVKLGCAQARLILTVSNYSRCCLSEHLNIADSKLRVVQEASAPAFRRLASPNGRGLLERIGVPLGARYLVYVGGFSPHKNIGLLVDVMRALHRVPGFGEVRLVLVGDYKTDVFYSCYSEVVQQVWQSGLEHHVLFSGYLADEQVAELLNSAAALVLPSFCEGVGLPALEAAACGAPVVATNCSPLAELLGGGAITLDPNDRGAWRDAIVAILIRPELRDEMRSAGLAASTQLSWQASASQLLSVFREVAGERAASA